MRRRMEIRYRCASSSWWDAWVVDFTGEEHHVGHEMFKYEVRRAAHRLRRKLEEAAE